jgi:transposase InsO family protein
MFSVLWAVANLVADLFKSRRRLEVENLLLRHQLSVALRQAPARLRLRRIDRAILAGLVGLWPDLARAVQVVKPDTILRWHRMGFRTYWRWKSKKRGGRPKIDRGLRDLIRRMSQENPLWGASRIHGELLMLGFEVAQSTVSKYMARGRKPSSQSWKTFLRNHANAIVAIDLCIVPTVTFERLFAFLVVGHERRRLLWIEVTKHPTAEWLARQITEAFPWDTAPDYLIRDNDRAYGGVFEARVGAMGIRDRPIVPRSPWQNGIAERLIGTLRRECLDQMLIFGEGHLRRILLRYADYYNRTRTHLALQKDAPQQRSMQRVGTVTAIPVLGGLHHAYVRI